MLRFDKGHIKIAAVNIRRNCEIIVGKLDTNSNQFWKDDD